MIADLRVDKSAASSFDNFIMNFASRIRKKDSLVHAISDFPHVKIVNLKLSRISR